jgi:hypothetical protein
MPEASGNNRPRPDPATPSLMCGLKGPWEVWQAFCIGAG